jgi:hypothetical protein
MVLRATVAGPFSTADQANAEDGKTAAASPAAKSSDKHVRSILIS